VDLDALARNLAAIRGRVGDAREILGVVKADAYGHGAVPVARRLAAEGIDHFGVALVEEGLELRRAGIKTPILILGAIEPGQIPLIVEGALTPAVYSMRILSAIIEASGRLPRPIPFHLKIDTGMGRLGFRPQDLSAALDRMAAMPRVAIEGVFTTLASSETPDNPVTAEQVQRFKLAVGELKRRGLDPGRVHMANSGGILTSSDTWFRMVRPGLALYGVAPAEGLAGSDLSPALSFHSRIVMLKEVPPDTPLGYGGVFRTSRKSRIATLAAGYDDGLSRRLHESGRVLVRGMRAPFAGRVSMDLATVDVTDIPGAAEGDTVTFIGSQAGASISAREVASWCGTIPWEIFCGIGSRVPRIYRGGEASAPIRSRFDETPRQAGS